jgi:hypothetical protein
MKRARVTTATYLVAAIALGACSGRPGGSGFTSGTQDGGTGPGNGEAGLGPVPDAGIGNFGPQSDSSTPGTSCQFRDGTDHDGDGFSFNDGDCNDCDPNMNPGAYDVPMNGIDEDCNGTPDDEPTGCDANVVIDSAAGIDGAKAIDLCRQTTETATGKQRTWGVIDAQYVAPDGSDNCADENSGSPMSCSGGPSWGVGHGNLSALGVNSPQQGMRMLAISSGSARGPNDPGYQNVGGFDKMYTSGSPAPYPKDTPACPGVITGQPHDGMALKLTIRVPTNAKSFSFNQNFFTYEFPDYICSTYNDSYVVMMTPQPMGLADGNIAFDQQGNPISVNNSLLQVCDAQNAPPIPPPGQPQKMFPCPLGSSTLMGTGFGADTTGIDGNRAATGWLKTTVPVDTVKGQDITLLFAIWDSGDGVLDSSALVDNFVWSVQPATGTPQTVPQPPK